MEEKKGIKGWILSGSHAHTYTLVTDHTIFYQGKSSAKLSHDSTIKEAGMFGTMLQGIQATDYRGKRIMVSAFLKTNDVENGALWFRVDDIFGDPLQFDNMANRGLIGDQDWTHCSCVLDIPEDAVYIHFGVLLEGTGVIWIDSFAFHEVNSTVPSTDILKQEMLPIQPKNLSFNSSL